MYVAPQERQSVVPSLATQPVTQTHSSAALNQLDLEQQQPRQGYEGPAKS